MLNGRTIRRSWNFIPPTTCSFRAIKFIIALSLSRVCVSIYEDFARAVECVAAVLSLLDFFGVSAGRYELRGGFDRSSLKRKYIFRLYNILGCVLIF